MFSAGKMPRGIPMPNEPTKWGIGGWLPCGPGWCGGVVGPQGGGSGGSGGVFEQVLQPFFVSGHLLAYAGADDEGEQDLADTVSLEVEVQRQAGAPAVVERLDRAVHVSSDGAVDTAELPVPRRIHLGHLGGHREFPVTDPPGHDDSGAHGHRGVSDRAYRYGALLPFGQ